MRSLLQHAMRSLSEKFYEKLYYLLDCWMFYKQNIIVQLFGKFASETWMTGTTKEGKVSRRVIGCGEVQDVVWLLPWSEAGLLGVRCDESARAVPGGRGKGVKVARSGSWTAIRRIARRVVSPSCCRCMIRAP